MRFLRKAGIANLAEVTKEYKEIELHLLKDDLETDVNEVMEILKRNKAIITAVHAPLSLLVADDGDVNYLSLSEVLWNEGSQDLFARTVSWISGIIAEEVVADGKEQGSMKAGMVAEYDEDEEENDAISYANSRHRRILLILHAGSINGCRSGIDGSRNWGIYDSEQDITYAPYFRQTQNVLKENPYVDIVIENVTPYVYKDNTLGSNTGYTYENIAWAQKCNEVIAAGRFGVVIDFCHLLASQSLLQDNRYDLETYFRYFDINTDFQKLIRLFHLSKFGKNGEHGEVFLEEDAEILKQIREICFRYARAIPITLEVRESEESLPGAKNFYQIMLLWNELHIFYKDRLVESLYSFWENLYYIFACDDYEQNYLFVKKANELKSFVMTYTGAYCKVFPEFISEEQQIDIPLFRVKAYIIYMRYINLLIDICKDYPDADKRFISDRLLYYMFHDRYDEVKFDGLEFYYNILWKKKTRRLYHMYDGYEGYSGDVPCDLKGENIFSRCVNHICNPDFYSPVYHYSTSKYFGRDMLKYFQYLPQYDATGNPNYNFEMIEDEINYVEPEKGRRITLQEYIDKQGEMQTVYNYAVDFSAFLEGEKDKKHIINKFCGEVNARTINNYVSPRADGEVVFLRKPKVFRYHISIPEFYLLMKVYFVAFRKRKYEEWDLQLMIEQIKDGTFKIETVITDCINVEDCFWQMPKELVTYDNLQKIVGQSQTVFQLNQIMSAIDFGEEEAVKPDMERYPKYYGDKNIYISRIVDVLKGR